MRLYVDANPIIYAFEGEPDLKAAALAWMAHLRFDPAVVLVTSRLTRLEVRCKPMAEGNLDLLALYDRFLESPAVEMTSITDSIVEAATVLRGQKAGAADAIHIATAVEGRCDAILTSDGDWRKFFPGRLIVVGVDAP